jgi:hypothetical protein
LTEIKTAKVELKVQVARLIMDTILGRQPVNAKPIKDERVRARLAIFVAETRMGWSVANCHQRVCDPIDVEHVRRRLHARIARLARDSDLRRAA